MHEMPGCIDRGHEVISTSRKCQTLCLWDMPTNFMAGMNAVQHSSICLCMHIYIYDFLKKNPQCLKELLIGQKLQEITLSKVFQYLSSVNIHPLSVYQTTMESEHQWRLLDFWGSTNAPLFSKSFFTCLQSLRTSLAFWDCQPSACIGGGKNCRANYKEQKKKVGVCTTEKYWVLRYNSALQRNQTYPQQQQPSVGSNANCMGYAAAGRACRKRVFLIRGTRYKHLIHLKVFTVMFPARKRFYWICYHSWDDHSIKQYS